MPKMRFRLQAALLSVVLLITAGLVMAAAPKKASSSKARGTAKTAAKSSARKKTAAKASSSRSRSRSKKSSARSKKGGQTWRSRQLAPEPDRYRQIQDALIAKGYLDGPATGQWDQASVDALRRFQKEQNLESNGKINSLSLIALGLGPKYDTSAAASVPVPQP